MAIPITRKDWEDSTACCLSKGRAGNACVYRLDTPEGAVVIKDFKPSPWLIRVTWGRWMIGHEYRLMKRLEGIQGVPQRLFRVDAYAFGMEFLQGVTYGDYNRRNHAPTRAKIPAEFLEQPFPLTFFRDLERLVCALHRRGVTHLDARNAKNVIVLPGFKPALIDFQSGVYLSKWMPRCVRKLLQLADLSSVYKHYYRMCYYMWKGNVVEGKGAFPENRARIFVKHLKLRKLWVLKGYQVIGSRRRKGYERLLLSRYGDETSGRRK